MNVRTAAEDTTHRFLNLRIEMNRIYDFHIVSRSEFRNGVIDRFETLPQVLAPMPSDQHHPSARTDARQVGIKRSCQHRIVIDPCGNLLQGIDDRIPNDGDGRPSNPFPQEVLPRSLRRGKMMASHHRDETAISFLWPRSH